MLKAEPYRRDGGADLVGSFPTDAEIEIAEELRRKLEERYFGTPAPTTSWGVPSRDHH